MKKYLLMLLFFGISFYAQDSLSDRANTILSTVEYKTKHPSIITENEWEKLELERLIRLLDRTKTANGQWGLCQLLHPVADYNEIMSRQKIVSFLVEHDDVLSGLQKQLAVIQKSEKELFSYWDEQDEINKACDHFYYNIPQLKKYLNKSSIALNACVATSMFDSFKGLLMQLCLGGLAEEFLQWRMTERYDFSIVRGIRNGLENPLRQHSLELYALKNHDQSVDYTFKDYMNGAAGSLGDRYSLFRKGYSLNPKSLGLPIIKATMPAHVMWKPFAFILAGLPTLSYDYYWGLSLVGVSNNIMVMHQSLNKLQTRLVEVAACCAAISNVRATMKHYSFIGQKCKIVDESDARLAEVIKLLSAPTFSAERGYFYSRGHVLQVHAQLKKAKKLLIPLLQSVALLDGYCSIAQLYKESQSQPVKFSFAEFVESTEPMIAYTDMWLPLLSAVANDLFLGHDYSGKILITGPNGSGKSVVLTATGVAAVLAQSWGIVPAASAKQTIFNTIKTVFVAHANLELGLSTFTAAKKSMQELMPIIKNSSEKQHVLALIDEPYIGTVDDESAKRIYNFGLFAADCPSTLLCLATHVRKPIQLAEDTHGVFANYHIDIREKILGSFELLFTIKKGPAMWWFEDKEKRGRFVDWLSSTEYENSVKNNAVSIDGYSFLLYSNK